MGEFKLISDYQPGGDQPQAIEKLAQGLNTGKRFQTFGELYEAVAGNQRHEQK